MNCFRWNLLSHFNFNINHRFPLLRHVTISPEKSNFDQSQLTINLDFLPTRLVKRYSLWRLPSFSHTNAQIEAVQRHFRLVFRPGPFNSHVVSQRAAAVVILMLCSHPFDAAAMLRDKTCMHIELTGSCELENWSWVDYISSWDYLTSSFNIISWSVRISGDTEWTSRTTTCEKRADPTMTKDW